MSTVTDLYVVGPSRLASISGGVGFLTDLAKNGYNLTVTNVFGHDGFEHIELRGTQANIDAYVNHASRYGA